MIKETPISSLAHRISFAVFRVARLTRHKKLRGELEAAAVELARDLSEERAGALSRLVDLAEVVEEMNEVNAEVLRRELNNLVEMIALDVSRLSPRGDSAYIDDIFDPNYDSIGNGHYGVDEDVAESNGNDMSIASIKERQTEILEFIRQFLNNCRMRDLIEKFPDVSERTLRNDVQTLIEVGLIERLGGKSGPNSYFVVIDTSKYSEELVEETVAPVGGSTEGQAQMRMDGTILLPQATRKI